MADRFEVRKHDIQGIVVGELDSPLRTGSDGNVDVAPAAVCQGPTHGRIRTNN
jgi:hypothetical protein